MSLTLWHAWTCPYCMRVRIALEEKGVPHADREVDLANKPAELLALNPAGGVPVLVEGGHTVVGSLAILEVLDRAHPEPRLVPAAPQDAARARELYERIDGMLAPHLPKLARGTPEEKAAATVRVRAALESLEGAAPEAGFLLGDLSIADLALAPFVAKLPPALRPSGLGLPRLARWEAAMLGRPAVARNTTPARPA